MPREKNRGQESASVDRAEAHHDDARGEAWSFLNLPSNRSLLVSRRNDAIPGRLTSVKPRSWPMTRDKSHELDESDRFRTRTDPIRPEIDPLAGIMLGCVMPICSIESLQDFRNSELKPGPGHRG